MHGRRSIIKRRDDDDITMTRPLNKRVSFSANNYTRLFQVDSDESTRHTNLDSTGQQSTMEHTMTLSTNQFNQSSSTVAMDTTHLGVDAADGFDWMDENMEVDSEPPPEKREPDGPRECSQLLQSQTTANHPSIDGDDKTRPVELRKEQTDSVKDEMLKVASKLLKPARSSDETRSALDIYGIQATLSSQKAGQQEKVESMHELDISGTPVMRQHVPSNVFDVTNLGNHSASFSNSRLEDPLKESMPSPGPHMESLTASFAGERTEENIELTTYAETVVSENDDDGALETENTYEESRRLSNCETVRTTSESWFEVTGVSNLDEESSLKCSQRTPSPKSVSIRSICVKESVVHSEIIGEDVDSDESQESNRLAMSRDSLVRPGFGKIFEESSAAESIDDAPDESLTATTETRNTKIRRSTMTETRNETVDVIEQSDNAAPGLLFAPRQLSPCLEVSSIRSERRTFDVPPTNSTLINSSRRTFDKLPEDFEPLRRRTFDKSPAELSTLKPERRTFDCPPANEASVLHSTQAKEMSDSDISALADEVEPSLYQNASLPVPHSRDRSTHLDLERPAADRSLEEWIELDPDLFSVFAEPLVEHEPVPSVEKADKQIVELDEERLEKALTLEEDEELNTFLRNERKSMRDLLDAQRLLISKLEAQFIRETKVLFEELPFYRAFSATKFKISSDLESKVVSAWYRHYLIPCVLIECREEEDGTVKGSAEAIDIPTSVCPLASYVSSWIKNALGGRSNFSAKSWSEAESKVVSAFEVIEASFNAFDSVKFRLQWSDERQQVFLKMLWRSRVINAYIDADLNEELVPDESSTTMSFRGDDLHAAWRNDGISTYRDRINKVHRRNLEIAAEEMMQAAKF